MAEANPEGAADMAAAMAEANPAAAQGAAQAVMEANPEAAAEIASCDGRGCSTSCWNYC